jgi:hypothetical protein
LKSVETGPDGVHLKSPTAIYFHKDGNKFYIVDSGNARLISYSSNGKPLKLFNAGGQLKVPAGMLKDAYGNLWIIERATNSLVYINLREKKIVSKEIAYQGKPLFLGKIERIGDKIAILDKYTGRVFIVNENFSVEKCLFPKRKDFKGFFDIKIKGDTLYAMETISGRIFRCKLRGDTFKFVNPKKKFIEPVSFDIDRSGNIYILDRYLEKIFIFNPEGIPLNSKLKGGNRAGELYYPWYIRIINYKIFIVNDGNGRVDIFRY